MEAIIKTLTTKEDILILKDDLARFKDDLTKEIRNSIKWMFIFWLAQVIATFIIFSVFLKK